MKIITSSPKVATPARPPSDELLHSHPASALFTVTVVDAAPGEVSLRLRWRHPSPRSQGAAQGALGCVVDYAARLAGKPSLGDCDIAEAELQSLAAFTANTLLVTANISVARHECAVFQCIIHAEEQRHTALVASARGTLLKRSRG